MRELSAYFRRKCGRYVYYQPPKDTVCPACNISIIQLHISYYDLMDLGHEERDRLISREIIKDSPALIRRITSPDKLYNQRELAGLLTSKVEELEADNQKLNETVGWMHATIWEQSNKIKELEREVRDLRSVKDQKE